MRKFILGVLALACLSLAGGRLAEPGEAVVVKVKQTKLRSAPRFLSQVRGDVTLGNSLTVQERRDFWYLVTNPAGVEGWLHDSAVSARSVELIDKGVDAAESGRVHREYVGIKGFTGDVENELQQSGQPADYDAVDRLQSLDPSEAELRRFIDEGRLGRGAR